MPPSTKRKFLEDQMKAIQDQVADNEAQVLHGNDEIESLKHDISFLDDTDLLQTQTSNSQLKDTKTVVKYPNLKGVETSIPPCSIDRIIEDEDIQNQLINAYHIYPKEWKCGEILKFLGINPDFCIVLKWFDAALENSNKNEGVPIEEFKVKPFIDKYGNKLSFADFHGSVTTLDPNTEIRFSYFNDLTEVQLRNICRKYDLSYENTDIKLVLVERILNILLTIPEKLDPINYQTHFVNFKIDREMKESLLTEVVDLKSKVDDLDSKVNDLDSKLVGFKSDMTAGFAEVNKRLENNEKTVNNRFLNSIADANSDSTVINWLPVDGSIEKPSTIGALKESDAINTIAAAYHIGGHGDKVAAILKYHGFQV